MAGSKNENFSALSNISEQNQQLLEECYGSYIPEDQPSFPGIDLKDGELVAPNLPIQSELFPEGQEIFFTDDPVDLPSVFRTSEGEAGLGVMLPLNSFNFDEHGGQLDVSISSNVTAFLKVEFDQSNGEGYDLCRFVFDGKYTDSEEMSSTEGNDNAVIHREFLNSQISDQEVLEFAGSATGFDIKRVYVSSRINNVIRNNLDMDSTPAVSVLMYLK